MACIPGPITHDGVHTRAYYARWRAYPGLLRTMACLPRPITHDGVLTRAYYARWRAYPGLLRTMACLPRPFTHDIVCTRAAAHPCTPLSRILREGPNLRNTMVERVPDINRYSRHSLPVKWREIVALHSLIPQQGVSPIRIARELLVGNKGQVKYAATSEPHKVIPLRYEQRILHHAPRDT
jgi:hypothetical protein